MSSYLVSPAQHPEIASLVRKISLFRAWYCYDDSNKNKLYFAPSKYIGYCRMNAKLYREYYDDGLDGRETEPVLESWFQLIPKGDPRYQNLFLKLRKFCSKYQKTPNALFRINILI